MKRRLVMKFGGALVKEVASFPLIAKKVLDRRNEYAQIVVVISAMGAMTDELLHLAAAVHPSPPVRELDMLISAGERISMALLAMGIDEQGEQAVSLTGSQSGIITCCRHFDARITDVRPVRLLDHLNRGQVVIVAGFQGVSDKKEITTLGRGGSDTTAVALAVALDADVEFYKDVGAIYTADPKVDPAATPCDTLTFDQAVQLVGERASPIHPRALQLAKANALPLHISSLQGALGTRIGKREQKGEKIFELSL